MSRRGFISIFGSAAATWPLAARAQQPAVPVIGYLYSGAAETSAPLVAAFRKGLNEAGFFEGRNIEIEYRWADNRNDRLPSLAADLVSRRVTVIFANSPSVAAAKEATSSIPITFMNVEDPVRLGFVIRLYRPCGTD